MKKIQEFLKFKLKNKKLIKTEAELIFMKKFSKKNKKNQKFLNSNLGLLKIKILNIHYEKLLRKKI